MKQQYVFIDDSGDSGLKGSNTTRFIVAAVLVVSRENLIRLSAGIDGFRAGLKWNELHEFKFRRTEKKIIKDLLKFACQFEFKLYAVVIDKDKVVGNLELRSRETLYNYAIKELLLRLKLSNPIIVIDGVADKKPAQQTRTYLRQALKQRGTTKCRISFVDSRKDSLVQLADIVAGSVARSYDKNKADHKDYLNLIKSKIKDIYEITP